MVEDCSFALTNMRLLHHPPGTTAVKVDLPPRASQLLVAMRLDPFGGYAFQTSVSFSARRAAH